LCVACQGSAAQDELPGAPEWQARPVTLQQALALARENSPQLQRQEADLVTSRAAVLSARGSFLPSLNLSSSFSKASSKRFDPTTQRIVSGSREFYGTTISTGLSLFDGFRRLASLRGARAQEEASRQGLVRQEWDVEFQVKRAFYGALSARELVDVARDRVERAKAQLRFTSEKLRYGTATRSDSLRAVLELRNAEMTLVQALQEERVAQVQLAQVIGLDEPVRPAEAARLEPRFLELEATALIQEALEHSPAVREAEARLRAAEAGLAASKGSYLPTLSASYSSTWSGDRPVTEPEGRTRSWSFRLGLTYPIFDGFRREENVARGRATLVTARSALRDARITVLSQMTQALADLETARFSIVSGRQAVAVAEEDLRVQQERYASGVSTILDVLTSQVALDEARVNLIRSEFDYRVAVARIESLLGRSLADG
jgi:outer membrane protein TolC